MTMYLGAFALFDLAPVVKSLDTPGREQIGRSARWEKDAKVLILFQDAWEKANTAKCPVTNAASVKVPHHLWYAKKGLVLWRLSDKSR